MRRLLKFTNWFFEPFLIAWTVGVAAGNRWWGLAVFFAAVTAKMWYEDILDAIRER